ncbi:MAG: 4-oxalocrotonate tautomerase family protein [Pseudomonadales bacterium]|uniref:4-oxalocrotonate tautomerase family enzyme n=1 Tax=Oleiphilus messinensis TaxID=141451 RepID=A0A1Y0I5G5_9GAMM|nr:4-oxalocrotonate tautomerase family protein [Oleiphilus messinensis]ARU55728.1 4-oxalocrotonate tautomerase family enzyme [Oleiphilus messinensis]MCG8609314.1 4-oxalocrotonate tautomerase family protein [Pseudomonadales bacterium]
MPYVNVQITKGASRDQKRRIVEEITQSLVTNLNKSPEHIHIVLQEVNEEDWGFAGMLTDEWKASISKK